MCRLESDRFSPCIPPRIPTRRWAAGLVLFLGLWAVGDTCGAPVDLKPTETTSEVLVVKVVLEVTGDLLSKDPNKPGSEAVKHPLKALGNLTYEEQFEDLASRRSLRYYEQAQADIEVDGQAHPVQLREDRRWVCASALPDDVAVLSLQGGLTRPELDLLEVPAGSHLLTALLPDKPVNVGDRWPLADQHLAHMFNLETISANDLHSELKRVEQGEARMELTGQVLGSVQGVITEMTIRPSTPSTSTSGVSPGWRWRSRRTAPWVWVHPGCK